MAYRFELEQSVEKGLRRIVREQIDRALRELRGNTNGVIAVHETRKCMKRLRALLRLVRPTLGEQTFQGENARFRDIAALLAGSRDRHVLRETIVKLESDGRRESRAALIAMKKVMTDAEVLEAAATPAPVAEAVSRLEVARGGASRLKLDGNGFEALSGGLEKTYRAGLRTLESAYHEPADEGFHDLRKSVQRHWRHMALLSRAWPQAFAARVALAKDISQILGDDHDLAVLVASVRAMAENQLCAEHAERIEHHARIRQQHLRLIARHQCEKLYAEKARDFTRRVGIYWSAARRIAEDVPAQAAEACAADETMQPRR